MLITIEGVDGSGKGTLATALLSALLENGTNASALSFPQYGSNAFAIEIGRYLNNEMELSGRDAVRHAALLYAADRSTARELILERLLKDEVVICDRYVESNLAHQVARVAPNEREELRRWIADIEYYGFKMPLPDVTILLNIDIPLARLRIREKAKRSYTDLIEDIHEGDAAYLERTRAEYLWAASASPDRWMVLNVIEAGKQLSIDSLVGKCLDEIEHRRKGTSR